MEIVFTDAAITDLLWWKKTGNKAVFKKINVLVESISNTPFEGLGKPEPLKYELSGAWSRRINAEHRLIYEIGETTITILSLKGHY